MKYHSFLTRRYLTSRIFPAAAVFAVAFGVCALITVLSVMGGFKVEMRARIRGSLSHLALTGEGGSTVFGQDEILAALKKTPHVVAAAPYVESMALYRAAGMSTCFIRGVDPLKEARVTDFAKYLLRDSEMKYLLSTGTRQLPEGRKPLSDDEISKLFSLQHRKELMKRKHDALQPFSMNGAVGDEEAVKGFEEVDPPQPIVVGIEAMRNGEMELGHIVKLSSYSPLRLVPCVQNFMVVGAFQTGIFEQDMGWMYMPLGAAQHYLELFDDRPEVGDFHISGVSIRLDDYNNADEVRTWIMNNVSSKLPDPYIRLRTWEEQRGTLLRAVDIEKKIIAFMMLFLVAFAGAMIFLILALMVIEKTRDLGVLRSLGATPSGVVMLFLRQGLILCGLGTLIGVLAGWGITANINAIHDWIGRMTGLRLFPPEVYYLTKIPVSLDWPDRALILGPTIIFGFLGSLVPAIWAARRDPIQALHHE